MVVLDSAGNLATQKEIDDAKSGSTKADMTRAKLLKSTFRILMTKFGICKIPFLFTNHTYMTQDLFSRQVGGGGTGPEYAASIILFLAKAKLKEGTEQTGIIVTAKPNKNRFVQPKNIKFHISFNKGMNPYIGLEEYISWDVCGIQRGNFLNESQYEKLSEIDKEKCRLHEYVDDKGKEKICYFQPKDTARKLCVEHMPAGQKTVDLNRLYTPEILTPDVLQKLEPIIADKFRYGTEELSIDAINEMLNGKEHVEENA